MKKLDTVEINSSIYGAPRKQTVENWAAKTGAEFKFAFKAPRQITHIMKLGPESGEAANGFAAGLRSLATRLGPILFQLPPFLRRDTELLDAFLASTSSIEGRVFEFRDQSWFEESIFKLLQGHGAGFCVAETEDMAPVLRLTSDVAYLRLRKDTYDIAAIDVWAKRISELANGAKETFVYLRHDETGDNAALAVRLAKKLG